MCKNHQGLQQKKEGICKIYYLSVTVVTPDICQILQEKSNGKLKMVLFRMKKQSIQIRNQLSPKLCYKPEMGGNKPLCLAKLHKFFVILACNSTYVQTMLLRISNLRSLTQIACKQTCCKPVGTII